MFNKDEMAGKWKEVKGEISKKWGEITDNDLEKTKGNAESLVGLLQQKLGLKKEEVHDHLTKVASDWRARGEAKGSQVADAANRKIDQAKNNLKN
ncbi:hypothetical protein BH10BDE1_BH10BDE1_27630 [soil metagenome]